MNRDNYLKSNYGIDEAMYEKLLKFQHGVCAICSRAPKTRRLNVDHDHRTGEVRGLLCFLCNKGTAFYRDNFMIARKFAEYLENPPARQVLEKWADGAKTAAHDENPQHLRVFEPTKGESILDLKKETLPTATTETTK